MAFSIGQNFFNDLLTSSGKQVSHHNSEEAIKLTYEKQKRLNNFFANNSLPVLLQSQKYSGMRDLEGKKEPLGGHINYLRNGIRNAPGTLACSRDYLFWGTTKSNEDKGNNEDQDQQDHNQDQQENFEDVNEQTDAIDQSEIIEKFTMDKKENFGSSNNLILVIILICAVIFGGVYIFIFKGF